jgi:murein DD-endopeptidase MepM/ murein hydrolase activator NlpD
MVRHWNNRWGNSRWESRDPWQQYREPESNFGWLKKLLVAALLFTMVYGAHESDTAVGRTVSEGVRYVITVDTDFGYLIDKLANLAPKNMDISVWKRVQNTVTKPADPLMYMTKPVDGKVVATFGWRTDPVLKQEKLYEGIGIEAPVGAPVKAAAAGKVKAVTDSAQYGKILVIEHSLDVDSVYGYLGEVLVKPEENVSQGQIVARIGKGGGAVSPLLYFEVRENGKAIDPLTRIKDGVPAKEGR